MEQQAMDEIMQHGIEFGKSLKEKKINISSVCQRLNHLQQNSPEKFTDLYSKLAMEIGSLIDKRLMENDKTLILTFLIGLSQEI
ncbi:hypothetical protein [Bacillus thuringiensis]